MDNNDDDESWAVFIGMKSYERNATRGHLRRS